MEFFQTSMGKKFYEKDVPRLVSAMERIADALENGNKLTVEQKNLVTGAREILYGLYEYNEVKNVKQFDAGEPVNILSAYTGDIYDMCYKVGNYTSPPLFRKDDDGLIYFYNLFTGAYDFCVQEEMSEQYPYQDVNRVEELMRLTASKGVKLLVFPKGFINRHHYSETGVTEIKPSSLVFEFDGEIRNGAFPFKIHHYSDNACLITTSCPLLPSIKFEYKVKGNPDDIMYDIFKKLRIEA